MAPAYLLSEEVFRAFDGQDLTGMAFLELFFRGHAKMFRHGGRFSVAVEESFLHGIPDGEKKMKRLGERVLEFSGEQAPVFTEKMLTDAGT